MVPVAIGQRFDRLTILAILSSRSHRVCRCRCDCGAESTVQAGHLVRGTTRSCGCLHRDTITKHGDRPKSEARRTSEYRAWYHMKDRCLNPRCKLFEHYGGRGIAICDRWLNDYAAFLTDIGRRPSPAHSLGRIDNDGPYAPDNCRWETAHQQQNNTSRSAAVTYNGLTLTIAEWARRRGLNYGTLRSRIRRYGWSVEKALSHP